MSSRLMADIFEIKNYPAEEKMFLMVLANNANDFGFGEVRLLDLACYSGLSTDRCLALLGEMAASIALTYELHPNRVLHGNYEITKLKYLLAVSNTIGNEVPQV